MNFDLLAKLNIIYYKSVTFFKKIKIVHIFLCLYLKYMRFAGISLRKMVGDGLENASFFVRIANKASWHSKEALFGVKRSLVCEAKKPCLETGWAWFLWKAVLCWETTGCVVIPLRWSLPHC